MKYSDMVEKNREMFKNEEISRDEFESRNEKIVDVLFLDVSPEMKMEMYESEFSSWME